MRFIFLIFLIFFTGCSNYFKSQIPYSVFEEKKIQATRKVEFLKPDNKIEFVAFATYLNNIDSNSFANLEYFFLEIYSPEHIKENLLEFDFNIEIRDVDLIDRARNFAEDDGFVYWGMSYVENLNKIDPLYIRQINTDEYDELFRPLNKWSSCYLIAFPKISFISKENLVLNVTLRDKTEVMDFGFKSLKFKLF